MEKKVWISIRPKYINSARRKVVLQLTNGSKNKYTFDQLLL